MELALDLADAHELGYSSQTNKKTLCEPQHVPLLPLRHSRAPGELPRPRLRRPAVATARSESSTTSFGRGTVGLSRQTFFFLLHARSMVHWVGPSLLGPDPFKSALTLFL
jgi:hypothetical protein